MSIFGINPSTRKRLTYLYTKKLSKGVVKINQWDIYEMLKGNRTDSISKGDIAKLEKIPANVFKEAVIEYLLTIHFRNSGTVGL